MTTRKMFAILLVANLLTVALVTAASQARGLLAAGPDPQPGGTQATGFDADLVPYVPWSMNYQGILKDSGGMPLTGSHELDFTIYRYNWTAAVYESVWTETHPAVAFTNGLFNVTLGLAGNPLRGDVFTGMGTNGNGDGDLELGVKVDGGAELSPRTTLRSVPYAHRADYVNRFPAPHYESEWYVIAKDESKTFTHNLGGDVDDYVVDLQFKDGSGAVHNSWYGQAYDDISGVFGAHWHKLTTSSINVSRGQDDVLVTRVRVRIWRIE